MDVPWAPRPVSPIVVNLCMESFEQEALRSCTGITPRLWLRFVDDTFVVLERSELDGFSNTSIKLMRTLNSPRNYAKTIHLHSEIAWSMWIVTALYLLKFIENPRTQIIPASRISPPTHTQARGHSNAPPQRLRLLLMRTVKYPKKKTTSRIHSRTVVTRTGPS